ENFLIAEFKKKVAYESVGGQIKFWRSKSDSEIDLIVENGPTLDSYEIKYNSRKKVKFAPSFVERYQPATKAVIHRENFFQFL
ncbi:MAG: DUF4143 domain-containing protein, partial [Bacteroidota bacterium]